MVAVKLINSNTCFLERKDSRMHVLKVFRVCSNQFFIRDAKEVPLHFFFTATGIVMFAFITHVFQDNHYKVGEKAALDFTQNHN